MRWHTGRVQRATLLFRNGHVFDGQVHPPGHGLAVAADRVLGVVPDTDLADLEHLRLGVGHAGAQVRREVDRPLLAGPHVLEPHRRH